MTVRPARMKSVTHRIVRSANSKGKWMHFNTGSPEPGPISDGTVPGNRSDILRDVIGHSDIATQCELGCPKSGLRCERTAVAYVEFHVVGDCWRFDCDEYGNACGFVCADHRDALENAARRIMAKMTPTRVHRLLRRVVHCPSCGRTLFGEFDILQAVVDV